MVSHKDELGEIRPALWEARGYPSRLHPDTLMADFLTCRRPQCNVDTSLQYDRCLRLYQLPGFIDDASVELSVRSLPDLKV